VQDHLARAAAAAPAAQLHTIGRGCDPTHQFPLCSPESVRVCASLDIPCHTQHCHPAPASIHCNVLVGTAFTANPNMAFGHRSLDPVCITRDSPPCQAPRTAGFPDCPVVSNFGCRSANCDPGGQNQRNAFAGVTLHIWCASHVPGCGPAMPGTQFMFPTQWHYCTWFTGEHGQPDHHVGPRRLVCRSSPFWPKPAVAICATS
jgi:hypothetical protein